MVHRVCPRPRDLLKYSSQSVWNLVNLTFWPARNQKKTQRCIVMNKSESLIRHQKRHVTNSVEEPTRVRRRDRFRSERFDCVEAKRPTASHQILQSSLHTTQLTCNDDVSTLCTWIQICYLRIFILHLNLHDFKRRESLPAHTLFTTYAETLLIFFFLPFFLLFKHLSILKDLCIRSVSTTLERVTCKQTSGTWEALVSNFTKHTHGGHNQCGGVGGVGVGVVLWNAAEAQ